MQGDFTTIGWLAGALIVSLLLVGSVGTSVARRGRHRSRSVSAPSPQQPDLTIQRTAAASAAVVAIQNFAFAPAEARIAVGATIVWTNHDLVAHTVTFRNGMADSGLLRAGQTFSYTFTAPGAFEYYCRVHPSMVGTVIVGA
jgi:plastocyanin